MKTSSNVSRNLSSNASAAHENEQRMKAKEINNILDPTQMPTNSTIIKILKGQFVKTVLNQISVQRVM
jgi:hypothetical protein